MISADSPRRGNAAWRTTHDHHADAHRHADMPRGLRPRVRDRHRPQPRLCRGRSRARRRRGLARAAWPMPDTISATCSASALSWGAAVLGRRQPSERFTYGLRSSSILAALGNAVDPARRHRRDRLGGGCGGCRIRSRSPASTVAGVAAAGIAVNGATALLFARGREPRSQRQERLCAHDGRRARSPPASSSPGSRSR